MSKTKEEWRQIYQGADSAANGRSAEALRRLDAYRRSRQVFIEPAPALAQMRINALLDGKELIMPGPGLRDGFYRLMPYALPVTKLVFAVSLKGVPVHGRLIAHHELAALDIGLMVAEAVAVDDGGARLGDGSGFFDLSCAILNRCGALNEEVAIIAAAVAHRLERLPVDPWDVRMHGILGPHGLEPFGSRDAMPELDWQQLPMQRIKKIAPLWREWQRAHPVQNGAVKDT